MTFNFLERLTAIHVVLFYSPVKKKLFNGFSALRPGEVTICARRLAGAGYE
jgi:hypothetical protein